MAYTEEQLFTKLEKADAAGDTEAAKVIADEIRSLKTKSAPVAEKPEPSTLDKAISHTRSFREGVTALPRGAFQLGANVGQDLNSAINEQGILGFNPVPQFEGPIELTRGAKQTARENNIPLPRHEPVGGQFGSAVNAETAKQNAIKRELMNKAGRSGFDATELAGMVASPASFMQTGFSKAPAVGNEVIKKSLLNKMAEGGKAGSMYAAGMPVVNGDDFLKEKVVQTGLGAGLGVGLPVAAAGLGVGGHYLNELRKPLTKKGIVADVEKFAVDNFSSGKENIVRAMQRAKEGQTAAQAVAQANRASKKAGQPQSFGDQIAATERGLSKKTAGGDELKTVYDKQQAGRENIIDSIAGTDAKYKVAEKIRGANAKQNYKDAFSQQIKADKDLVEISKNPYFKKATKTASDVIGARGKKPKDNLVEYMHLVKKGIDKQLNKTGDEALGNIEKAESMKLKTKITKWLDGKTEGAYGKARDEFAKDSVVLNRMDTGRVIKDAMVNPSEVETVAPLLKAVKDAPKTLKNATGFKGYENLKDVLSKKEVAGVNKVKDEMLNEVKRNKMATRGQNMLPELSGEIEFSLPRILSRPIVITNSILAKIGKDKTPEYRKVLSEIMRNPKELERILTSEKSDKYGMAKMILDDMIKISSMSTAKEAGEQ